jgi:hypothetical protein
MAESRGGGPPIEILLANQKLRVRLTWYRGDELEQRYIRIYDPRPRRPHDRLKTARMRRDSVGRSPHETRGTAYVPAGEVSRFKPAIGDEVGFGGVGK